MIWNFLNKKSDIWHNQTVQQLLALLLILLACGACSNKSVDQKAPFEHFTRQLDERIPGLMNWYNIPGISIALVQEGQLVWSGAYGYADLERNRKMTVDAICRAESISKSVTAWGVMELAERGLINLDDPAQRYVGNFSLPQTKYHLNEVTIRRLLSNSAGMPLGSLGEEYPPNKQKSSLQKYLEKEVQLVYKPGAKFEYSNPGFNLLELLVEKVTGRDFNEYMESEVLLPLGMNNSSFEWKEVRSSRVPMGYDLQGNSIPPYVYPYKASGGLFSTVKDIARFAIAEMAPNNRRQFKVLNGESIQDIQTPQINTSGIFSFVADDYGFGHFIETLPDGKKAVWHGGQGHGWMTHFHVIPETGDGIVIFSNSQRSWPLIAHVLSDWSRWVGNGRVKFSRITSLVVALWVVTGITFLIAFSLGGKVLHGVITDRRRLSMTLHPYSKNRIMEFVLWAVLSSVLLWSVGQDYLFISSIFPVGASWLGWGILLLSLVLLFSTIFPRYQRLNYIDKTFGAS